MGFLSQFFPAILMLLNFGILIGMLAYFFVLATRLVRAIERIADKYTDQE
jgi:hypothetical protein